MADINKEFGERLRALINKSGVTQKSLAEKVGVTPSALTFHLKGQVPSSQLLVKYASNFKVSIDYLITGGDPNGGGPSPGSLMISHDSPFYELIRDMVTMPESRQMVLRDILRVIVESERK